MEQKLDLEYCSNIYLNAVDNINNLKWDLICEMVKLFKKYRPNEPHCKIEFDKPIDASVLNAYITQVVAVERDNDGIKIYVIDNVDNPIYNWRFFNEFDVDVLTSCYYFLYKKLL